MKLIDEIIDLLSNTDTELENALIKAPVSYTHLTLPTTPYV